MVDEQLRHEGWPWKRWLILAAVLFPLLLFAAAWVYDATGKAVLDRAVQEAYAIGGPVTMEELEAARKQYTDDQNGALLIISLQPHLSEAMKDERAESLPVVGESDLPPLGQRWSEKTDREVNDFLQRMSGDLATIDRLREYSGGRFPLTFTPNPMEIPLPHLSLVRSSARLKSLQVLHRAMHGDRRAIVSDMTILLQHGQVLADESALSISMLVHVQLDWMAIDTIERVCSVTTLSSAQLTQIEPLLAGIEQENRLYWGLRAERGFFIGLVEWLRKSGSAETNRLGLPASSIPIMNGWMMRDEAVGARLYNRVVRAQRTSAQVLDEAEAVKVEVSNMGEQYKVTQVAFGIPATMCKADMRLTGKARSARLALAAERYRLADSQFPAELSQLVPEYLDRIPDDPFDSKPLRYRVMTDRIIVYSIGEDKTDNGGEVITPDGKPGPDYGFTILVPSARGTPPPPDGPTTRSAAPTTSKASANPSR